MLEEDLQGLSFSIKRQYREGNQVANYLVRQGEGGIKKRYIVGDELPAKLRGISCLDKLGLPSLRK